MDDIFLFCYNFTTKKIFLTKKAIFILTFVIMIMKGRKMQKLTTEQKQEMSGGIAIGVL
jgi:hypothetical protein